MFGSLRVHPSPSRPRWRSANSRKRLRSSSSAELINTQTATVSSTLNADQINRMPTPTRNALNAVTFLPGVNTATTNRDSTHQRPAGVDRQHHDRRRQQQRQLQPLDRRVLRVGVAAPGCGRGGHGDDGGGGGERWRQRRRRDQFPDPLGHQPLQRQRSTSTAGDPSINTNYWFNERNGLPKNDIKLDQYGGRVGGPIVDSGAVRRTRQGVLLRQLRAAAIPQQLHTDANDAASERARRVVPLHRRRTDSRGERAQPGGAQRADLGDGSDSCIGLLQEISRRPR